MGDSSQMGRGESKVAAGTTVLCAAERIVGLLAGNTNRGLGGVKLTGTSPGRGPGERGRRNIVHAPMLFLNMYLQAVHQ